MEQRYFLQRDMKHWLRVMRARFRKEVDRRISEHDQSSYEQGFREALQFTVRSIEKDIKQLEENDVALRP